ncbi:MAG: Transcriptional regulator, TetR family [Clostridiaceae bacterium]|nr:Transcriptional regulator, TetR family [Clostridiaceae bacterium]
MNPGFSKLSEERKNQIINAGFRIFAQNAYKKAPVAEIAAVAGISKSLLFYHFKNKKELYLFLWKKVIELTSKEMTAQNVLGTKDYFEMMMRSLRGKCNLIRKYPYASEFSLRAYYEQNTEIRQEIQNNFREISAESEKRLFEVIDTTTLRDDINLHEMYQEMIWAADGYMHTAIMQRNIDADLIELDFEKLIAMWKKVYHK